MGSGTAADISASAKAEVKQVQSGLAQLSSGDTAAAKTTFAKVLAGDPTNVYALYNLGYIAQTGGDAGTAAGYYGKAIDSDPDYAPALFNDGIVLEKADLSRSVALFRAAVKADPTMAAAYVRLGFALQHQGRLHEAAAVRSQGLALDPSLAMAGAPAY